MLDSFSYSPWYSLIAVGASLIAIFTSYLIWRNKKLPNRQFWILVPMLAVIAIYGGRWWYLIFNPSSYTNPIDIFIPFGGRSILGSIFFVVLAMFLYVKYWGGTELEFRKVFDILLPCWFLAQAIARWGNFVNQEIYGQVVDNLNYLPKFISDGMFIDGQYRQPLFLFESIANMIGFLILVFIVPRIKSLKSGTAGSLYLVIYGTIRCSMELFRDPDFIMSINAFPTSFFLSFLFLGAGIAMFVYYQFFYEKTKHFLSSSFNIKNLP